MIVTHGRIVGIVFPLLLLLAGAGRPAGVVVDSQPGTGGTPLWNLAHPVTVPIASAVLHLQNAKTREIFTAISDQHGEFQFGSVPDGTY